MSAVRITVTTDDVVTSPEWVEEILRDHVPDPSSLDIIRRRVYTHHGRVASDFRVRRQLIAGDAAHLMPVWLGQGWNSGVRDAMNLGWKLATVLAGDADDALLDTYTEERLEHATKMVELSMTMGDVIKMTNPVAVAARDAAAKVVNLLPQVRDYFGEMRFRPQPRYARGVVVDQSTLEAGVSHRALTARSIPFLQTRDRTSAVGVQFPQPRVTTKDGAGIRLDDVTGTWWTLVLWINDAQALLPHSQLGQASYGQRDVIEPGRQLGETPTVRVRMLFQGQHDGAGIVQVDPCRAEVGHLQKTQHAGVEIVASDQIRHRQSDMIDGGECRHRAFHLQRIAHRGACRKAPFTFQNVPVAARSAGNQRLSARRSDRPEIRGFHVRRHHRRGGSDRIDAGR